SGRDIEVVTVSPALTSISDHMFGVKDELVGDAGTYVWGMFEDSGPWDLFEPYFNSDHAELFAAGATREGSTTQSVFGNTGSGASGEFPTATGDWIIDAIADPE